MTVPVADYLSAAETSRPDEIRDVIESVERYNPDKIPLLEGYVDAQLAGDSYDRDANLALLKLYQFNPDTLNVDVVAKVLVKALTALPDPDFGLCCCLLSEETCALPVIVNLTKLQELLETASFSDFWAALRADADAKKLVAGAAGFNDRIRDFAARIIAITYQAVEVEKIAKWLDLEAAKSVEYVLARGWKVDEADSKVVLPPLTKDNDIKPTVVTESLRFDQLTKLIAASNMPY